MKPDRVHGLDGAGGVELRHLRAFVAVAEELHFTRAAHRLFLAQQGLSERIRQLEAMLGVALFERTTRTVKLTPAGKELLEHAPSILAQVESSWRSVRRVAAEGREHLRIAYTPAAGHRTVAAVTEALRERQPGLAITAHETWFDDAVGGVRRGRFDLAYVRCASPEPDLETPLICTEPLVVMLGERDAVARSHVVTMGDLEERKLVIWPRDFSPTFYDHLARAFAGHFERGLVYEYEHFSRQGFLGDAVAQAEVTAGRAFCPRLQTVHRTPPAGYVHRPLRPVLGVGLHVVHRPTGAGRQARRITAALEATEEVAGSGTLASASSA